MKGVKSMKNKKLILPVMVLLVSTLCAAFMLLCTTDFAFCLLANREQSIDIHGKENILIDTAFKLEPNYTNMQAAAKWYASYNIIKCDSAKTEDNEVCKDYYVFNDLAKSESYMSKCVNAQKTLRDYYLNRKESEKLPNNLAPFAETYPVYSDNERLAFAPLLFASSEYAIALYANGDKEESMAVVEDLIERAKKLDENHNYEQGRSPACYMLVILDSYIMIVHSNNETNKDFQNWLLEKEKEITTLAYNNMFDGKETENAFENDVHYVPFK